MISKFSDDLELVWFMFFKRIVVENPKNTILVFNKNCFYYLNLVFYLFFYVFFIKKKNQTCFIVFLVHLIF